MSMILKGLSAFLLMLVAAPAMAETGDLGPAVGDEIPHSLKATMASGEETDFDALVGDKGLALFFVRSLDWCPYCRAQAVDVNQRAEDFAARGLNLAFVSYDAPEKQQRFADKWKFRPALLSDQNIEIIDAFGIRNEKHAKGSRFYGIPHPVVFIVNPDRTIAAKLYEEDYAVNDTSYKNRPAVDIILEAADKAAY
ncbi:MAG: peroxiredoxin family protein [Pseudomonadota bacterium]